LHPWFGLRVFVHEVVTRGSSRAFRCAETARVEFGEGALYEITLIVATLSVSFIFAMLFARWIEGPAKRASRKIDLAQASKATI
jgi:peptidoglycan/LPS O-acetylase OafA/YrhL